MAEKIMLLMGFICIGYFAGIAAYAGLSSKFPFIWLAAGLAFFAAAILIHKRIQIPAVIKTAGIVAFLAAAVVFISVECLIVGAMFKQPDKNLDYILVLGAQVKGNRPSLSLKYRIDAAEEYLEKNPDTKAVLSGGKGQGEEISEAECMYRELVKVGLDKKRLLKEEKSTSTNENIVFSKEILEKESADRTDSLKIGVVTNSFHVFRGTAIARHRMEGEIQGIPAKSNAFLQANYLVREFLGVLKDRTAGNL